MAKILNLPKNIYSPRKYKNSQQTSFFDPSKSIYILSSLFLFFHFFSAWQWPLLNDESYYWDWGRNPHLSYIDAPPAVSWLSYLSTHFFEGNLGARFLIPILSLFSGFFLVECTKILNPQADTRIAFLLFASIPIFFFTGTFLMPDGPLLFASSGALYFALKACANSLVHTHKNFSLKDGLGLGFFIGLGIVSKYQGVPLSIGFFLSLVFFRGLQKTFTDDWQFWMVVVICAFIVASPVFIWNIQNNFASFQFQGQHGFSKWTFHPLGFCMYILALFFVLFPWFSYLILKQGFYSIKRKNFFQTFDMIPMVAFLSIFIFIMIPALGNSAQIHWITPSILFLIPLVAANWTTLTAHKPFFWKCILMSSFFGVGLFSLIISTPFVQKNAAKERRIFGLKTNKIQRSFFRNLIWANFDDPHATLLKIVPQIEQTEKQYVDIENRKCIDEPYLGAFNWRWASQFAFHLPNQPRVFSIDLKRATYYSWRDHLEQIAGCRFMILGHETMYYPQEILKVMNIDNIQNFTLTENYTGQKQNIILIEGILKDAQTISTIQTDILHNIHY